MDNATYPIALSILWSVIRRLGRGAAAMIMVRRTLALDYTAVTTGRPSGTSVDCSRDSYTRHLTYPSLINKSSAVI